MIAASRSRFRPLMLTVLSTMLGLSRGCLRRAMTAAGAPQPANWGAYQRLFVGTSLGFPVSAWLIARARLPSPRYPPGGDALGRLSLGLRAFWRQPRLRGLAVVGLVAAVASAMVTVSTVVLTQGELGLNSRATAIADAVFGGGSILATLLLPRILEQVTDRTAMLAGAGVLAVALLAGVVVRAHASLLLVWLALRLSCAIARTLAASVVRRCCGRAERQHLDAVHVALSHVWLIAAAGTVLAARLWPADDAQRLRRRGALAGDGGP